MDGFGFQANPDEFHGAATGIRDVLGEIADNGLGNITTSGEDYGHDGLHGAVADFLSTMHGAIEVFRRDAESAGEALTATARSYLGTDVSSGGLLRQVQSAIPGGL